MKDSRDLRPAEVQKQIDMLGKKKKDESKGNRCNKSQIKAFQQLFLNSGLLLSILDIENVKSGFKTILKKRPNNFRTYILLLGNYEIFLFFETYIDIIDVFQLPASYLRFFL